VILKAGIYYIFVKDWLSAFPREQMHLVRFEDYISDRDNVINDLFAFLGLGEYILDGHKEDGTDKMFCRHVVQSVYKG
jgi:hypothetical protein